MTDVVDRKTRSRMMSGIQGKNTKPEITVRKALFARGYRYKLHDKTLPGKPDIVLPKYRAVIFVHGCFWHMHGCALFKWPSTRKQFWHDKITGNHLRDKKHALSLQASGWRRLVVWECAIKGKGRIDISDLTNKIEAWLVSDSECGDIAGVHVATPAGIPAARV